MTEIPPAVCFSTCGPSPDMGPTPSAINGGCGAPLRILNLSLHQAFPFRRPFKYCLVLLVLAVCIGDLRGAQAEDSTTCVHLKVLLSGSDGFLGKRVKRILDEDPHIEVQTFDLANGQDILDAKAIDEAVQGVDVVVHLAAVSNLNFFTTDAFGGRRINIEGTRNILESAKRYGAVVLFASTCCAYGNNGFHPSDENSPLAPTEPYAQSKVEGEQMVLAADERNIVMRLATFYGPGMRGDLAVARFIEQAHNGEPLLIHGSGHQTRTLTHVDDVANGIAMLVSQCHRVRDRIFNISSERSVSVLQVAEIVMKTVQRSVELKHVNDREGQIFKEEISSKRMRELGWIEEFTFEEGVRQSVEHYQLFGWASEGARGVDENGKSVLA